MKKSIAIIGAGVSGLSAAQLLKDRYNVTVFERESSPGGLIRCKTIQGSLFHICGGHVFNTKHEDVLSWFWNRFNRERDFEKHDRNASLILRNGTEIPYPIENHVYLLDEHTRTSFFQDLELINGKYGDDAKLSEYDNFEDFLKWRFGKTLYELYFGPYNAKIWRRPLSSVPLSWMEGKLPMPTVNEMKLSNEQHIEEKTFVHSSFWYSKRKGSQFLADTLAEGLNIRYNTEIKSIRYNNDTWTVNDEIFDKVLFCGNIKDLTTIMEGVDLSNWQDAIRNLEYHGTTSVFCEIDANPYSWIYLPSSEYESHRIICTGNFSAENNARQLECGKTTATIEFTDEISKDEIIRNLEKMPYHPKYLTHHFSRYTYPIQNSDTRRIVSEIKSFMEPLGFYFSGRFSDWEYYNMDVAIKASFNTCNKIMAI